MEKPHKSIEELAREQGVKPGALDTWLAGPWSEEDEEVNAFLTMRREDRARELARQEAEDDAPLPAG